MSRCSAVVVGESTAAAAAGRPSSIASDVSPGVSPVSGSKSWSAVGNEVGDDKETSCGFSVDRNEELFVVGFAVAAALDAFTVESVDMARRGGTDLPKPKKVTRTTMDKKDPTKQGEQVKILRDEEQ